jgi:hypothetical protein
MMAIAAPLRAQTCDFQLLSASWSPHSSPDSIDVNFAADVVGPVSSDPQNPTDYGMTVSIRFDGGPLGDDHELHLRWWHGVGCPTGCPNVVCAEKEWSYKGVVFRDQSRCTLNAQQVCGCPPLGTPVVHRKTVRKPPNPGLIEIEIVPLHLTSCNPINPQNDRIQIPYPGSGTSVPGLGTAGVAILVAGLGAMGALALRRRSAAHGA